MLATQTTETGPDTKDVKQWIKEKIAQTIKALQKRYVASDTAVTSEDAEANLLCCALEAVFIHGIKGKHVKSEVGGRGRKGGGGRGGALPQPDFWGLLKSVTHRDVILELEGLSFISSGVGRCRAWVRLALNDGLLECYLLSLLRENSKLAGYYQQGALLLDAEDREVLLSLLQGLASLSFQLSYKSAVLNEWTVTPLALAGLCPPPAAIDQTPHANAHANSNSASSNGKRKESWDTASQSSGGSDVAVGVGVVSAGRGGGGGVTGEGVAEMRSSNLSLDTTGSSQLSSSLSSDSLLQGCPERDSWEIGHADAKKPYREESTTSSQDSMREDSYISGLTGDHLSESTAFSSLDNDTHTHTHTPATDTHLPSSPHTHTPDPDSHLTHTLNTHLTPMPTAADDHSTHTHIRDVVSVTDTSAEDVYFTHTPARDTHQSPLDSKDAPLSSTPASDPCVKDAHLGQTSAADAQVAHTHAHGTDAATAHTPTAGYAYLQVERSTLTDTEVEVLRPIKRDRSPMRRKRSPEAAATTPTPAESAVTTATTSDPEKDAEKPDAPTAPSPSPAEPAVFPRRSGSTMSRRRSTDMGPTSWISEDDFYKPETDEYGSLTDQPTFGAPLTNGSLSPPPEPETPQVAPSVVHRRHKGLSNPFRGLLKLGVLEKRSAVGMWWEHHCELSPFELRLYLDPEERAACDNSSLLRCEEARLHGDGEGGRFVLAFAGGKRLHLRAGTRGEAEDWVERVQEAVAKIRPATAAARLRHQQQQQRHGNRSPNDDDEWEVLRASGRHSDGETPTNTTTTTPSSSSTPASTPASPEHAARGPLAPTPAPPPPPPQPLALDWARPADPEPDAIKEAVVYQLVPSLSPFPPQTEDWTQLLLSLSLEALSGFRWHADHAASSPDDDSDADGGDGGGGGGGGGGSGHKAPLFRHAIQTVRDVVPDAARGGPEFFKVVTSGGVTLTLRAESGEEARAWRGLIRGALDSYLDTDEEEEVMTAEGAGGGGGGVGGASGGGISAVGAWLAQGSVQRLVQHRLKGDAAGLLPHLGTVPTERGLDAQSFRCAGCSKKIGVSMGKAKLCEFSAQYYCESCHRGDAIVIPSRLVHNWDLTPREVSKQALKLLGQIEHEPLLNLDLLNPDLYEHSETMATVRSLRQKLRLLGDYVLLCRSGIKKKLQAKLKQRSYLLESDQIYSVEDLRQIAEGQYQPVLQSLVLQSAGHVHDCELCTQRGFICQICNADDIIFPFQFETTSRCRGCKAVFHSSCREDSPTCPRCVRLQRYLERDLQD
ncbi:pleckstrin homology domain-containing family M member 1 [Sardina pilchardus]|uniref:pleckstrin homology domain-containing family M member 1 n=1 Tax=Sardina pilchardus TaxID=27697 RepID=UPI002E0DE782